MRRPSSLEELEKFAKEEWKKIDMSVINALIESFPKRVQTCIELEGNITKY